MAITYLSEGVKVPAFRRREVNSWLRQVAKGYGYELGDIAYQFCDNEKILEVNRKYLEHDYYTDIITFGQEVDGIIFADIIISIEMVEENAMEYGVAFEEELFRVMVHGILHLCGLDDTTEEQSTIMHQAEEQALALLPKERDELWRK